MEVFSCCSHVQFQDTAQSKPGEPRGKNGNRSWPQMAVLGAGIFLLSLTLQSPKSALYILPRVSHRSQWERQDGRPKPCPWLSELQISVFCLMILPRNPCVGHSLSFQRAKEPFLKRPLSSQNWSVYASSYSSAPSIHSTTACSAWRSDIVSDISLLNLPHGIIYDALLIPPPKNLSPSCPCLAPTFSASVGPLSSLPWTAS